LRFDCTFEGIRMLTARKVRFWYRVHKWTSLVCTALLLMSCVTGLPLIFGDEIDQWVGHHVQPVSLPVNAPLARLDSIVAAAHNRYPNLKTLSLAWDDDAPRIFLDMAASFDPKPGQDHMLIFDTHTGKLLEELGQDGGFMQVVSTLHFQLYAGLPGELFLGFMAILFVVALISGAVVYGPFMRRLDFGTVRTDKSRRLKWFDLHNLLGIVTLTWGLVVGATGVMNTLAAPLFDLWRGEELPRLLTAYKGKPIPNHLISVDSAVDAAKNALPRMTISSIGFPNDKFGSPHHYLVWTHGNTPVTAHLFTPALVDVQTGSVTATKGLPWYLRALEISRPLHFGDYGGLPLKIIWALFDVALIIVLISGLYLWLSRRKTPVENELDRLVKLEDRAVKETPAKALAR
jgi:uncharacterized iron-regulated membrane protein